VGTLDNKFFIYAVAVIAVILAGYFLFGQGNDQISSKIKPPPDYRIPDGFIHWHSRLRIMINNEEQQIPADVGISIGKVIDTQVSGTGISPIHTHTEGSEGATSEQNEHGRKLHMETLSPKTKPETLTLGYFFKVWDKTFNKTCIFDKCNGPNGTVNMFVNDQQNYDFGEYFMRDGDRILIIYG